MGPMVFSPAAALAELGWQPRFTIESGYADSYAWFCDGGRESYEYDFSRDDDLLRQFG